MVRQEKEDRMKGCAWDENSNVQYRNLVGECQIYSPGDLVETVAEFLDRINRIDKRKAVYRGENLLHRGAAHLGFVA